MTARLGFQVPQPTILPSMESSLWISIRKWKIRKKKCIYQQDSQFPNPIFFGILIIDKEEKILSLKLKDFIPKIEGRLANHAL